MSSGFFQELIPRTNDEAGETGVAGRTELGTDEGGDPVAEIGRPGDGVQDSESYKTLQQKNIFFF